MPESRRIRISKGNSKVPAPNLSLTPGISCSIDACKTCYKEGCYARKAYRQYPNVRDAWDTNTTIATQDPFVFVNELFEWTHEFYPEYFRLHVGGDFVTHEYYDAFMMMAESSKLKTKYLAFTKKYKYSPRPWVKNVKVVWSMWPGIDLPDGWESMPTAWLEEDDRRPTDLPYIMCPGHCGECQFQCWEKVDVNMPVVFKKH